MWSKCPKGGIHKRIVAPTGETATVTNQWQIDSRQYFSTSPPICSLLARQTNAAKSLGAKNGYLRSATAVAIKLPPSVLLFSSTSQSDKQTTPKKDWSDFQRFCFVIFCSRHRCLYDVTQPNDFETSLYCVVRKQPKNITGLSGLIAYQLYYNFYSRKQPENVTGTRTVWADCKLPVSYHLVTVCLQKL